VRTSGAATRQRGEGSKPDQIHPRPRKVTDQQFYADSTGIFRRSSAAATRPSPRLRPRAGSTPAPTRWSTTSATSTDGSGKATPVATTPATSPANPPPKPRAAQSGVGGATRTSSSSGISRLESRAGCVRAVRCVTPGPHTLRRYERPLAERRPPGGTQHSWTPAGRGSSRRPAIGVVVPSGG
jgi:hypothetical protein